MATQVFKLVALDAQQKINPLNQEGYFRVGSAPGQVATAVVENELKNQEARVLSSIPEKWRRMTERIEGLIGVRYAAEGQTRFTPAVAPKSDTQVYVNYPANFGQGLKTHCRADGSTVPYAQRTWADCIEDWELDEETGEIVLGTPLTVGSHVILDFNHDGMSDCLELKMCVIELTACEILRGYPTLSDNVSDKIDGWEKNAQMFLRRLWNGDNMYRTGVHFFDRLKLVGELETRTTPNTGQRFGGFGFVL